MSPNPLNLTAERTASPPEDAKTVTIRNTGGTASGPIDVMSASVLDDPNHGDTATWFFSDLDHDCLGQSLAPGASCSFTLVLEAGAFANRSWTGDLVAQATPGNAVHVPVNAHVTSKLLFDPVTELDATPALDASTHFVLLNDSAQDLGPMSFSLVDAGMPGGSAGTISLATDAAYGIPPCSDGMTLAAGASCQWLVTYTNGTGAGGDTAFLVFNVPGVVQAQAGFNGVGLP